MVYLVDPDNELLLCLLLSVHVCLSSDIKYSTMQTSMNFSTQKWPQVERWVCGLLIFQVC